jgi:selenocysteine lyase/cysteine desulfurase
VLRSRSASTRRQFLATAAAGAAGIAWPARVNALANRIADLREDGQDPWATVRNAFLIPDDRVYMNVGTLGAQPRIVVDAVTEHTRRVATTFPPGIDWDALKSRLGRFINCDPAGLVFPRNTTEGMNFVANGLDFTKGDEILTTDHEHIGGLCPWQLVAKRHGLVLRQLQLPVPPSTAGEVVDVFRNAIGPRTRVISVSHVTFTNGLLTPVEDIVKLCRQHGIIAVIDGAHPPGMMRIDLQAIDPDFYASSPHKWLLAPQGTGFLWMREEWRTKLWPTLASGGWDDLSLGAQRFNHLGTFDESRLAGLDAALAFQEAIGIDAIEARAKMLRMRLHDRLAANRRVHIVSPAEELVAGMASFHVDGIESLELQRRLASIEHRGRTWRVRTRVIGEYDYGWMRLSPHIYNSPDEVDLVADLVDAVSRKA